VEISATLGADLRTLTDALGQPGTDLEAVLRELSKDIELAVDSYCGLSMTIVVDTGPLSLSTVDPVDIGTSLLLPLTAICEVEYGSTIVFFARTPGAFVDLAADLSFTLGLGLDSFVIDDHLLANSEPGLTGLAEMSAINQAIGVLIDQGSTPHRARAELHRLALRSELTLADAATQLVRATVERFAIEST
jgi:hypothetical protein